MTIEYRLNDRDDCVEMPLPWGRNGTEWDAKYEIPAIPKIRMPEESIINSENSRPYAPKPYLENPDDSEYRPGDDFNHISEKPSERGYQIIDFNI